MEDKENKMFAKSISTGGLYVSEFEDVLKRLQTRQVTSDTGTRLSSSGAVVPVYDRMQLAKLLDCNEVHNTCINFRANAIAGLGYKFMTDAKEPGMDKIINWAKNPSNRFGYNLESLLSDISYDFETYNEFFLEVISSNDDPVIIRANPQKCFVVPKRNNRNKIVAGMIDKYLFMNAYGTSSEVIEFKPYSGKSVDSISHNMIHCKMLSQIDDFYGTARYVPVLRYAIENGYISDFNTNFFKNGAKLSYFLAITGQMMTKADKEELERSFISDNQGLERSHKIAVVTTSEQGSDVKLQEMSKGFDGSFMTLRQANGESITLGHQLSPRLIGAPIASGIGGGSENITDMKKFVETVDKPRKKVIETYFNAILEEEFGVNPKMKLNHMDITNAKDDAIIYNIMHNIKDEFGNRAISIEEIRDLMDLSEVVMKSEMVDETMLTVAEKVKYGILSKEQDKLSQGITVSGIDGKPTMGNESLGQNQDDMGNIADRVKEEEK